VALGLAPELCMSRDLLVAVLLLAYGPLAAMALLYLVGLALRAAGRPRLLEALVERTKVPRPVDRGEEVDGTLH